MTHIFRLKFSQREHNGKMVSTGIVSASEVNPGIKVGSRITFDTLELVKDSVFEITQITEITGASINYYATEIKEVAGNVKIIDSANDD